MPTPVEVLEHYQSMKRELLQSSFRQLCEEAHGTAVSKGWYEEPVAFPSAIAMMHCELSEALEAWRRDEGKQRITEEFADVCIRLFDTCGYMGLDLGAAIADKMEKNKSRPYRHGGKKI